jgi:hypothetical protein
MEKWKKKEKKDAVDFGGKAQRGSGNQWFAPGDSKTHTWLIESKQTSKKSYSLKKSVLDKLCEEALFSKRLPLLSIDIDGIEVVTIFKEDFINVMKDTLSK